MIGGKQPHGYTIVEALIFLAVSSIMFVAAVRLVAGQQNKAQFNQGIQEIESRLRDVINNVATGYYPSVGNIHCEARAPIGTGITINSSVAEEQGTNAGCTFIGTALQFVPGGVSDNTEIMRTYTVAGQRLEAAGREVTALKRSAGAAIAPSALYPDAPTAYEDYRLPGNLSVVRVSFTNGGSTETIGMFGVFNTFASYSGNNLNSGSTYSDLAPIRGTTLNQDPATAVETLSYQLGDPAASPLITNPSGGLNVCLKSGTTDQYVVLTIGSTNRQSNVKLDVRYGDYHAEPLCV